jgi:hypothetical protein
LDFVAESIDTKFGGLAATAYGGAEQRVIHLRAPDNDKDLLRRQLQALMDEGLLTYEERA